MQLRVGVVCSRGIALHRGGRPWNNDSYLVCHNHRVAWREEEGEGTLRQSGQGLLVAVADGEGPEDEGAVASGAAMRVLAKLYAPDVPADPARAIRRYLEDAHLKLYWKARAKGRVRIGASLAAAWILDGALTWVRLGTCRLRLVRSQVVAPLGSAADPDAPGARALESQRFIQGSQGLGDDTALHLASAEHVGQLALRPGDHVVLSTDGLWRVVDDFALAQTISAAADPQAAAVACMELAMQRGSTDNITVVVVRVEAPAA